jgi:hypothetical protein
MEGTPRIHAKDVEGGTQPAKSQPVLRSAGPDGRAEGPIISPVTPRL